MRPLVAIVTLALLASAARADDWDAYPPGEWADGQAGYDVSVDLNVSGGVTLETFDGPLSSYGEWVVVGGHGRVWRPRVAAGWRPYYYGRWEWTNEGWLWVSDEPYGWAVYHYGRWAHDPYHGWVWVPGYEWAPAWVSWRSSGDVVGWAPLAPGLSVYVTTYPFVDFCWTFVPTARFVSVPVYQVAYAPAYTRQWYQRSAPAPARPAPAPGVRPAPAPAPTPAWGGPAPRLVAERTGRPLTPARIVQAPAPGARARPGEIPIYRPGAPAPRGRALDAVAPPVPGRETPPWRGDPARRPVGAPAAPAWRPERRDVAPVGPGPGRAAIPPPAWRQEERRGAAPAQAPRPQQAAPAAPAPGWRGEPRREAAPAPPPRGQAHGGGRSQER